MAMKAKAMAKSSEKEEAKAENKVEKKSDEKQVPYRYKGEDGNWAWKLK
jgi:hypothetical protein